MKTILLQIGKALFILTALVACSPGSHNAAREQNDTAAEISATSKAATNVQDSIVPAKTIAAVSPEDTVEWQTAVVPRVAPDTIPQWVFAKENLDQRKLSCTNGAYFRNIVTIAFKPGTQLKEKVAAIRLVHGRVVGGSELVGTDGWYFVKIDPGKDGEGLCTAIYALSPLPQTFTVKPIDFKVVPL